MKVRCSCTINSNEVLRCVDWVNWATLVLEKDAHSKCCYCKGDSGKCRVGAQISY